MFFLPLFDDNPPGRAPVVNWVLIAACVLVFLYQQSLGEAGSWFFLLHYAAIPKAITGGEALSTLVTSAFLHGGWLHLGSNMLYLWIFGDNVEDRMGPVKFILFYVLCAVAATLSHVAIDPSSGTPLVGASGAIAGVLAAYLILYPRAKVRVLMVIVIFIRWIQLPAFVVLAVWILFQLIGAPASLVAEGGTAYFAHIGGFVAGLALTPLLARRPESRAQPGEPPEATGSRPAGAIATASAREVRNEFADRYRYRRRRHTGDGQQKGPWG